MPARMNTGACASAAADGIGPEGLKRAEALFGGGVDVIVIDTATVIRPAWSPPVAAVKRLSNDCNSIAGKC